MQTFGWLRHLFGYSPDRRTVVDPDFGPLRAYRNYWSGELDLNPSGAPCVFTINGPIDSTETLERARRAWRKLRSNPADCQAHARLAIASETEVPDRIEDLDLPGIHLHPQRLVTPWGTVRLTHLCIDASGSDPSFEFTFQGVFPSSWSDDWIFTYSPADQSTSGGRLPGG